MKFASAPDGRWCDRGIDGKAPESRCARIPSNRPARAPPRPREVIATDVSGQRPMPEEYGLAPMAAAP